MVNPILAGNIWQGAETTLRRQNTLVPAWRSDVAAILTEAGALVEWVKYAPYGGDPFGLPAGDTDSDGKWSATDDSNITGGGAYHVRKDANLDGVVDSSDVTHANSITGGYQTLGRGVLSSAGVENRIGYAGYRYDDHLAGAGRHLYHVRYRVYQAQIGRWLTRDPLEYVDGMSLYQYVRGRAISLRDPFGRCAQDNCKQTVNDFVFWTYRVPDCHLEIYYPPPPAPVILPDGTKIQLPAPPPIIITRCEDRNPCMDMARQAGLACCDAGGSTAECLLATESAWQVCNDPDLQQSPADRPFAVPPNVRRQIEFLRNLYECLGNSWEYKKCLGCCSETPNAIDCQEFCSQLAPLFLPDARPNSLKDLIPYIEWPPGWEEILENWPDLLDPELGRKGSGCCGWPSGPGSLGQS